MGFLQPDDVAELRGVFAGMTHEVRLALVTDDPDLRTVVDEVAATTDGKLIVDKQAETEGVEAPSMTLTSELLKGKLVFLGMPVGYEMATLVGAVATAGGALEAPYVGPETQAALDALDRDVVLEVFSTPG